VTTFVGPAVADTPGIGALTLGGLLDEVTGRFGPLDALVFDDPLRGDETVRWSYGDLAEASRRVGRALVATGVAPGDTVAILMGNRPEAVASIFGVALAGAVAAPMSTFATAADVADMVARSSASVVLTQSRLRGRELGAECRELAGGVRTFAVGTAGWADFLAGADDLAPGELAGRTDNTGPDDPALVIFTSGTTDRPKAILHAHRAPALQSWVQAGVFGRHTGTRMFSALPLFWTAGLNTALGATLAAGGCWVMQEVFDAPGALGLLARERVTEPYTLPHQTAALAELAEWAATDLSSLRCVYGKSAYARHPAVDGDPTWIMPVGYGLSETCAFVAGHRSDATREAARNGSGPLMPGAAVRILGADGALLGVGEMGEIAVGGAALMLGYLDGPDDAIDADGFFHTGDVGFVDPGRVLHFEGRTTEMIKTAGANVSPAEVELQLRRLPAVKLSRVVGVPDERLGEVVVACVVLADGADLGADDVVTHLRDHLAPYKVPRHVLFLDEDEMPMTGGAAKVRDPELADLVARRLDDSRRSTHDR